MQCLEDKFEELAQKFKQKNHGGDADMTAAVVIVIAVSLATRNM
jgi:hypothetical protein